MTKYLISFPSGAMQFEPDEFPAVVEESHQVVRDAKAAGVYVFGGGINEDVAPVLVAKDGSVTEETYPRTKGLKGGFMILELPDREEAERWAAKTAAACRCPQELLEFGFDPES